MIKRSTATLKWLILGCVVAIAAGAGWWYYAQGREGVYTYDQQLDKAFILDLFKKDWYWLISDYSPNYSPEFMLDYKAAHENPQDIGKLIIKTYRVKNNPVGFVAYFENPLLEGYILFLGIGKEYRSKGYARALMQYAINDLTKRGMKVIRLITRTDNERGQKLYKGLGFKEIWTSGAYVKFEKIVG